MKNLIKSFVILFVLMLSRQAAGQTITFDEMAPLSTTILGTVQCGTTTGFRFVSEHFHLIGLGPNFTEFTSNGTPHIGYESGRGLPIQMERLGGGTFTLQAVDLGEFFFPAHQDRPEAEIVQITGNQLGGGVVTHSVALDGIFDGIGGAADYQHFVLPNTFVNLTSVVFTGQRAGGLDGGISVDNLQYSVGAPETLAACVAIYPQTTPTITIDTPTAGNVIGTIAIQATPSATITSVQFKIDGVNFGAADVAAPFATSWDTTAVIDGQHTLTAEGRDASNVVVATASVIVTVRNSPVNSGTPYFIDLDGADDYVEITDANALSFGNGTADTPLTAEMWIRPDVLGRSQLLGKWGESTNQEYKFQIVDGTFRFDLHDQSSNASAFVHTLATYSSIVGSWHHIAVTYDGRGGATAANGITIYLDGVSLPLARYNDPAYVAMENLSDPLQVGREGALTHLFDGGIDELRLWSVARTQGQLQGSLSTELTGTEPGLVGYWKFNDGVGTTEFDASAQHHTATLLNGTIWVEGGPFAPGGPDVTAPTISNVVTSGLTPNSATISFITSESATGWVSFTATGSCPCIDVFSAGVGTAHSVTLTGLLPNTTYTFFVNARDASNNLQTTPAFLVTTLNAVGSDVTPPLVSNITPAGTVSGTVPIAATVLDSGGVASVTFRVDGVLVGAPDTTAPYSVSWNSTTVADGVHTITVEGLDTSSNLGSASAPITVQNGPLITSAHFVDLDGVDDFIQVADADALSFGTGTTDSPLTIEMWIRPDVIGRSQLLGKWGESTNQEYKLQIVDGTFRFDLRDNSAGASAFVHTAAAYSSIAGSWHHLAVTYSGIGGATAANGITIYLDGVSLPLVRYNNPAYVAMENLSDAVQIGREGVLTRLFEGGLDEIRLWNVARTAPQLQAAMNSELTGSPAGLVGYWKFNNGVGVSEPDGSGLNHPAALNNGVTWVSGGPLAPGGPDTTAPTISNVVTSGVTPTNATIAFTTSEPATGWVSFTSTGSCPCIDVFSAGFGTAHSVTLTGLAANTTYTFFVNARDAANNLQTTAAFLVTTTPIGGGDVTPPTVTGVGPAGVVAGTVQLVATASDASGVVNVRFRVDGVLVGAPDTTAPYAVSWDTATVADGVHTIVAEALDAANNLGVASATVTVQNTPAVTTAHFLELDGIDDIVQVADANSLSFGNSTSDTPLTIEVWFRPDALGRSQLLGKWGEDRNQEYKLRIVDGTFRFDLSDNSAGVSAFVHTAAAYPALVGAWHHLAVTYDGRGGSTAADGLSMFIDGGSLPLVRYNNPAYVAMENLGEPLVIGQASALTQQYDGGLDEVRLWNVMRTPAQILAVMSTELTGTEAGLVAYWRFNNGSGTIQPDVTTQHNTATLVNGTAWAAGGPSLIPQP